MRIKVFQFKFKFNFFFINYIIIYNDYVSEMKKAELKGNENILTELKSRIKNFYNGTDEE